MTSRRWRAESRHAGVCDPARLDDCHASARGEPPGAARREAREKLLNAARCREIDLVLVWRLDHWRRSVTDLLATLQELEQIGLPTTLGTTPFVESFLYGI
jgi:DNA invertase Pin-like site-specific DNA recombinase